MTSDNTITTSLVCTPLYRFKAVLQPLSLCSQLCHAALESEYSVLRFQSISLNAVKRFGFIHHLANRQGQVAGARPPSPPSSGFVCMCAKGKEWSFGLGKGGKDRAHTLEVGVTVTFRFQGSPGLPNVARDMCQGHHGVQEGQTHLVQI